MEDLTLAIVLRMAERLMAVGIAGASVYFGFRLFSLLPTRTDSSGKIELPGFGVVLSKVGPGVFFAAFGCSVLLWSLNSPVSVDENDGFLGAFARSALPRKSAVEAPEATLPSTVAPQDRAIAAQSIQILNCAERVLTTGNAALAAEDVEEGVRLAKVAITASVWDEAWGSLQDFRQWSLWGGESELDPELLEFYHANLPRCPS